MASTAVTPGTRSFRIRSTPPFSVSHEIEQESQAPDSFTWTTPSSVTPRKSMSPPSIWRAGRMASMASRMAASIARQRTAGEGLSGHPGDVGAEGGEGSGQVAVAPVDVDDVVDLGLPVGGQPG